MTATRRKRRLWRDQYKWFPIIIKPWAVHSITWSKRIRTFSWLGLLGRKAVESHQFWTCWSTTRQICLKLMTNSGSKRFWLAGEDCSRPEATQKKRPFQQCQRLKAFKCTWHAIEPFCSTVHRFCAIRTKKMAFWMNWTTWKCWSSCLVFAIWWFWSKTTASICICCAYFKWLKIWKSIATKKILRPLIGQQTCCCSKISARIEISHRKQRNARINCIEHFSETANWIFSPDRRSSQTISIERKSPSMRTSWTSSIFQWSTHTVSFEIFYLLYSIFYQRFFFCFFRRREIHGSSRSQSVDCRVPSTSFHVIPNTIPTKSTAKLVYRKALVASSFSRMGITQKQLLFKKIRNVQRQRMAFEGLVLRNVTRKTINHYSWRKTVFWIFHFYCRMNTDRANI